MSSVRPGGYGLSLDEVADELAVHVSRFLERPSRDFTEKQQDAANAGYCLEAIALIRKVYE